MFLPLKDGVSSAEHENSLLGADVSQIVDAISLGWYESVFQSYMAQKVSDPFVIITSDTHFYLASESCFFSKVLLLYKAMTHFWERWENNLLARVLP